MMSTTYVFLFVFLFFILSSSHIFSICLALHSSQCHPFVFRFFFSLSYRSLRLLIRSSRSQCADSGSMYMMNWAGTPAAQVPPRVHGDTTRGELLCSAVTCDTLLLCMHTWNSLHRPKWVNSPTAASNMISQCFIHNIRTLQDKYWSYSGEVSALTHTWRIVLATEG